jgi:hypothetical protein
MRDNAGKRGAELHKLARLPDNHRSMKLPEPVFVRSHPIGTGPILLVATMLGLGCVSLDKPALVEECATKRGCSNEPFSPGADAKPANDDAEPGRPDLRPADEPTGPKSDVGPDIPSTPDAGPDQTDVTVDKKDVVGPEPGSTDLVPPTDRGSDSRSDVVVPDSKTDLVFDQGQDNADGGRDGADKEDIAKDDGSKDDVAKDDLVKDDVSADDVVKEDVVKDDVVKDDVVKNDVPGPEAPRDLPVETVPSNCAIVSGASPSVGSAGHSPNLGTATACIATCDDISGWGCANDDGRSVSVNGSAIAKCGDAVTKKNGYYVFRFGVGSNASYAVYWWGTYSTAACTAPAGGF